jgi:hypothetical protein
MTPLSARMRQIGIGRKSLVHIRPLVLRGCQSPTRLDGGLATHHEHHSIAVAIANEHMWPETPFGRDTRHRTTPKCDRQVSGHQWVPLTADSDRQNESDSARCILLRSSRPKASSPIWGPANISQ